MKLRKLIEQCSLKNVSYLLFNCEEALQKEDAFIVAVIGATIFGLSLFLVKLLLMQEGGG